MTPRRILIAAVLSAAIATGRAVPAAAILNPPASAPNFTKNALNGFPTAQVHLSDFAGKVVVLHILGWN